MIQRSRAALGVLLVVFLAALPGNAASPPIPRFRWRDVYSSPTATPLGDAVVLTSGGVITAVAASAQKSKFRETPA